MMIGVTSVTRVSKGALSRREENRLVRIERGDIADRF